jgi:hypothetical protein
MPCTILNSKKIDRVHLTIRSSTLPELGAFLSGVRGSDRNFGSKYFIQDLFPEYGGIPLFSIWKPEGILIPVDYPSDNQKTQVTGRVMYPKSFRELQDLVRNHQTLVELKEGDKSLSAILTRKGRTMISISGVKYDFYPNEFADERSVVLREDHRKTGA